MAASKLLPIGLVVVGIVFIVIAALQPAFLWDMGKVRQGREAVGDTGVRVFFAVLGAALAAVGVYLSRKR